MTFQTLAGQPEASSGCVGEAVPQVMIAVLITQSLRFLVAAVPTHPTKPACQSHQMISCGIAQGPYHLRQIEHGQVAQIQSRRQATRLSAFVSRRTCWRGQPPPPLVHHDAVPALFTPPIGPPSK